MVKEAPLSLQENLHKFDTLVEIIARLRAPDGCPWDKEQTHQSLRENLLSEAYEVLEALDDGDKEKLCEELGDLLLQIVLHAQIAKDDSEFKIDDDNDIVIVVPLDRLRIASIFHCFNKTISRILNINVIFSFKFNKMKIMMY